MEDTQQADRLALEERLRQNPDDAVSLRDLGWLYYGALGNNDEALRLFAMARNIDGTLCDLDMYQALALVESGRMAEAEDAFIRALETSSNRGLAHAQFGMFLALVGRAEEAEEYHLRALESDESSGYFARLYAKLLMWLERYDEAGEMFRRAITLDPEDERTKELYREYFRISGKGAPMDVKTDGSGPIRYKP